LIRELESSGGEKGFWSFLRRTAQAFRLKPEDDIIEHPLLTWKAADIISGLSIQNIVNLPASLF
jgi:hypothetical protein